MQLYVPDKRYVLRSYNSQYIINRTIRPWKYEEIDGEQLADLKNQDIVEF